MSVTKSKTERTVIVSAGNLKNRSFPLSDIIDLFPKDCIGKPSRKGGVGVEITLHVDGLPDPIPTDIPTRSNGAIRYLFRDRSWVRKFYDANALCAGDKVSIKKTGDRSFSISTKRTRKGEPDAPLLKLAKPSRRRVTPKPARKFTFIDLFAGIGGMRIGMEQADMECVFSSEWDKYSQITYKHWFGEQPHGDINDIQPSEIPDHDVLTAGFPCQPFSIAGVTKKNALGRAHGFLDKTQGTLFFNIARILEVKRPKAFLLENVKNLKSHDKGKTWHVIRSTLTDLGYAVFDRVIDAAYWVPQHRERVFIVGFDKAVFGSDPPFEFPTPPNKPELTLKGVLDRKPPAKYTLTDHLWEYLQNYAKKHAAKGNGFGFGLADLRGVTRTMSARYYKDGAEILIPQRGKNPRRLTPNEAKRLMGFPDRFRVIVSDLQAYRQFGNAVVPKVVHAVAVEIVRVLNQQSHSLFSNQTTTIAKVS